MFTCALCKEEKEGKKYVYSNSTREVRLLVCKSCHAARVAAINSKAAEIVSSEIVTGILRPTKEE